MYRIRKLLFRIETVTLPLKSELDVAVVNLCSIFQVKYLQECKEDIVSDKRYIICTLTSNIWDINCNALYCNSIFIVRIVVSYRALDFSPPKAQCFLSNESI